MMVIIKDSDLSLAASKGMDEFIQVFVDSLLQSIGGDLNADNMQLLNADQLTLLGYVALRDEVMDGGFIQLIHNGWGDFIYKNPFDKAVRAWGLPELCSIVRHTHKLFTACRLDIERDMTDEEFMSLYEKYPQFDDYDDEFVEQEEAFTNVVAHYIDGHIDHFATIEKA